MGGQLRFSQVTAWRQAAPLVAALFVVVLFVVA
jgi:Tfp pilus assembly protein PilO